MTIGEQVIGRFPVMGGQIQYDRISVSYGPGISQTVEIGIAADIVFGQISLPEILRISLFPQNDKSGWLLDLAFFASISFTKTEAVRSV